MITTLFHGQFFYTLPKDVFRVTALYLESFELTDQYFGTWVLKMLDDSFFLSNI